MSNQLALPSFDGFDGAVTEKGQLTGARKFIASKLGISIPKGTTSKDFKAIVKANGQSDRAKELSREYDKHRNEYYRNVNTFNGALAADPSFRKTMKMWKNPAGNVCVNVAYRKEPKLSVSAALRADNAEARVKALEAQLAKLLALQNAS
jgi:hypothetical protein